MATTKVTFFAPEGKVLPSYTDWEITAGANPNTTFQRAQALGKDGDEILRKLYGGQVSYTETGTMSAAGAAKTALSIPNAGAVVAGAMVDSVSVAFTNTAFPQVTINSHQHLDASGTAKVHDTCREYVPSVTIPMKAMGVPTTIKETATGTPAVFTTPDGVGIRSLTYTIQLNHTDEPDGDGNQLAGDNYDGNETIALEFTGEVAVADLSVASDWDAENNGKGSSNTAATTRSVTLTHHLAHKTAK